MSYDMKDFELPEINPMIGVFAAGVLLGGLVGALGMLLAAPQSGERTRKQIRRKALALRDQATDNAEEALSKAEESLDEALKHARHLRKNALGRVDDAQKRGEELVDNQLGRVKAAVEAGKKVVRRQANHN